MLQVTINKEVWDGSGGYLSNLYCPLATAIRRQLCGKNVAVGPNEVYLDGIEYTTKWDYAEYCSFKENLDENPQHSVTLTLTPQYENI